MPEADGVHNPAPAASLSVLGEAWREARLSVSPPDFQVAQAAMPTTEG